MCKKHGSMKTDGKARNFKLLSIIGFQWIFVMEWRMEVKEW